MIKLVQSVKDNKSIAAMTVFFIVVVTLSLTWVLPTHLAHAGQLSLVTVLVVGILIVYGTSDYYIAHIITIFTFPVVLIIAISSDYILEIFWRKGPFHTESAFIDLVDASIGAALGLIISVAISYWLGNRKNHLGN